MKMADVESLDDVVAELQRRFGGEAQAMG
jgi:hypothetical protein